MSVKIVVGVICAIAVLAAVPVAAATSDDPAATAWTPPMDGIPPADHVAEYGRPSLSARFVGGSGLEWWHLAISAALGLGVAVAAGLAVREARARVPLPE